MIYLKTFVKSANSGKWQSLIFFFESKTKINGFLIFFAGEQILRREKKSNNALEMKLETRLGSGSVFFEVRQVQLSVFGYFTQCSDGFGTNFSPFFG